MTRTTKANDPPHNDPEAMAVYLQENQMPRFYGKSKDVDTAPGKTKKDGGGKGNWGHAGDETEDLNYNFAKTRRRSNSNSATLELKTKFEVNEDEPVFEEELHGAPRTAVADNDEDGEALSTSSTNESNSSAIGGGISTATGGTIGV